MIIANGDLVTLV